MWLRVTTKSICSIPTTMFRPDVQTKEQAATVAAGTPLVLDDIEFGRIGLSTCYDLRFPALYRALGAVVDLIVVPSAFTETTGRAHWEPLRWAKAKEN